MFETLCIILNLDDEPCQSYAFHGLGRLHHPEGPGVIQQFIDARRHEEGLNPEWLEECRDGT